MTGIEYISLAAVGFASGGALGCLWPRFFSKKIENDVLIFPDEKMPCNSFYTRLNWGEYRRCRRPGCRFAHWEDRPHTSLMKIFMSLNNAVETIDLCIFKFTQRNLADFLITAATRHHVRVRIITDAHVESAQSGSANNRERQQGLGDRIPQLQQAGIPIRVNRTDRESAALMHNKFVIIDGKCVLQGSFNWTQAAVMRNHETIISTNDKKVVKVFIAQFNRIWSQSEVRAP